MYSKRSIFSAALLITLITLVTAEAGDVKLPEPQMTGGPGVFDTLKNRTSATSASFPTGAVSMEDLSTILWAASGLNRPGKGWTVPMAMGREPYCKVYVAGEQGVFLYDWKNNSLKEIAKGDVRSELGSQGFIANAPYILVFVVDGKALDSFGARGANWGLVAVGAMTQNVYLATEALNISARYLASVKPDAARAHLKLLDADTPVCIMPLGKRGN